MSISDPLADMFTIIRNGNMRNMEKVEIPSSKLKLEILAVLKKEGYIRNYKHISDNKQGIVRVYLKFKGKKEPVMSNIKRISRPGLRVYAPKDKIPRVLRGMGLAVLSTSSGIITDTEARTAGVGGEVICYVW